MDELNQICSDRKKVVDKSGKGGERGHRSWGHSKKQPWNKKLEGQVADLVKKQLDEELKDHKKETEVLAENSTLISVTAG